jgi:hypothetical protein
MMRFIMKMLGGENVPTDKEVGILLENCETIINRTEGFMNEKAQAVTDFKRLKDDFSKFKSDEIKLRDGTIDAQDWKNKKDDEKLRLYARLNDILDGLRAINKAELSPGLLLFSIVTVLLILTIGGYMYLHKNFTQDTASQRVEITANTIVDLERLFTVMESRIETFNQGRERKVKGKTEDKDTLESYFNQFKKIMMGGPLNSMLSFKLKRMIGILDGEIEMKKVKPDTFNELRGTTEAEMESLNTRYFWLDTPGKWYEIAFWSSWGTMVGILFYVAGLLSAGTFHTIEIPMMATEIVITPLVVITIFFLFSLAGITDFKPSESSSSMILGISFILGFSIRRTMGLLDNIKKRLLPDPSDGAGKSS